MTDARILVTGSRSWSDARLLADTLLDVWHDATELGHNSIVIVHGGADGADTLAGLWAAGQGLDVEVHEADWSGPCGPECPPGHRKTNARGSDYCPLAGHRRNQQMIDAGADLVVAFQRAGSRGTADAMNRARKAGLPVRHITG
ncbi:DUF2493 domain-containing protein [Streptomyces sp. NPDC093589]|uniref:DUF2493 domain-containing protein n=1 Tax=Streptomyces sp. NPDC093589 TaxID=3366043 RepID=UPI00381940B8